MKTNMLKKSNFIFLVFIFIVIAGCQNLSKSNDECSKFKNEIYTEHIIDSKMKTEALTTHKSLLRKFNEDSVEELNHESYQMQFYSSHGNGKLIRFEKKNSGGILSVKCNGKVDWQSECKEYQIDIELDEWHVIENMIYEFNFWTSEEFRENKNVLDGYVYFLEGKRPKAEKCNKKIFKLVGRSSPRYDKIAALCENILEYEDQLKFRYEQMNKIK